MADSKTAVPKRFVPITQKINTIILLGLIIGIGGITVFIALFSSTILNRVFEADLKIKSEILYTAIENFMLPGEAELVENFIDDFEGFNQSYMISLLRTDGSAAFSDNQTIETVNERLMMERFPLLVRDTPDDMIEIVQQQFAASVGMPPVSSLFRYDADEEGHVYMRIYQPLINKPNCGVCHGEDHTVRGVIDMWFDIADQIKNQRLLVILSGAFFLLMVIIVTILITQYMKSMIIKPIHQVGETCERVTEGDFESRVMVKNNDEIGKLGTTVNSMVQGLYERYELSRFVSNTTLESIGTQKEGQKVPVTLLFSDIRGFTSYTEKHAPEEVIQHLNSVLNFQTGIIHEKRGDIDKYVGDEIVATFSGNSMEYDACIAALEIQDVLTKYSDSVYGGLTVGIGINSGEVILGSIGSENRADFTVIGDNVNIASRLCDSAEPGEILISNTVFKKIFKKLETEGPYKLKVKGKGLYIKVYKLKGYKDEPEE